MEKYAINQVILSDKWNERNIKEKYMKTKAIFYHDAGCTVCQVAKSQFVHALDPKRYEVEEVDLAIVKQRIPEAAEAGVQTIPALVMDDHVFHINRGADLTALL